MESLIIRELIRLALDKIKKGTLHAFYGQGFAFLKVGIKLHMIFYPALFY